MQYYQLLVLMKGHPGVGKSTIARTLAQKLRFAYVDKDDSKEILLAEESRPGGAKYPVDVLSYELMWRFVEAQMSVGNHVVVDSPLARGHMYTKACELAKSTPLHQPHALVVVVEVVASDENIWRQRLEGRSQNGGPAHKPQTWSDLQALLERYQDCWKWSHDPSFIPGKFRCVLDSTSPSIDDDVKQTISWIARMQNWMVGTERPRGPYDFGRPRYTLEEILARREESYSDYNEDSEEDSDPDGIWA